MKRTFLSSLLLLCCAGILLLSACNESEPLPEGVSSLPDVGPESFVNSETGEIEWPSDLLPEDFPEAEYEEIYSVERVDNEVIIVLFAKNNPNNIYSPKHEIKNKLTSAGYTYFYDAFTNTEYKVNRDGFNVSVHDSEEYESHLTTINKESPTGYTYEIRVTQTDIKIPQSMYWEYPDMNTDLGLEELTFEAWPYEYLPEEFPCAEDVEGLTVTEIYQNKNGVFITIEGPVTAVQQFETKLWTSGFYTRALQPHVTEDGDYFYYPSVAEMEPGSNTLTIRYQVCKFNEHVNTDK